MKRKFLLIFLSLGVEINFSNLVSANGFSSFQSTNNVVENTEQFWRWYQKLNAKERIEANTFIKEFLLNEKTFSENLNSFSSNRGQALILSSYIEQAKKSSLMRDFLTCIAYEGGSGCAP